MNILRICSAILMIATHISCFCMDQINKNVSLPLEVIVTDIGLRADIPTQRSMRLTCRYFTDKVSKDDIRKLSNALNGNVGFSMMLDVAASYEKRNKCVQNQKKITMLFDIIDMAKMSFIDRLSQKKAILEASIPDTPNGFSHFNNQLVCSAIWEIRDKGPKGVRYATDLLATNPHNFCFSYQEYVINKVFVVFNILGDEYNDSKEKCIQAITQSSKLSKLI